MVEAGMAPELAQRHQALASELEAIHGAIRRARQRKDLHTLLLLEREMTDTGRQLEELVAEIQAWQQQRRDALVAAVLACS